MKLNPILLLAVIAWAAAQVLKFIIDAIINRRYAGKGCQEENSLHSPFFNIA